MEELGLMGRVLAVHVIARTQQEELHANCKALWLLPIHPLAPFSCLIYTSPSWHPAMWACGLSCLHVLGWDLFFFPNKSFCWWNTLVAIIFSWYNVVFKRTHQSHTPRVTRTVAKYRRDFSFSLKHHRNKLEGNYSPAGDVKYPLFGKYSNCLVLVSGLEAHPVELELPHCWEDSKQYTYFVNLFVVS